MTEQSTDNLNSPKVSTKDLTNTIETNATMYNPKARGKLGKSMAMKLMSNKFVTEQDHK